MDFVKLMNSSEKKNVKLSDYLLNNHFFANFQNCYYEILNQIKKYRPNAKKFWRNFYDLKNVNKFNSRKKLLFLIVFANFLITFQIYYVKWRYQYNFFIEKFSISARLRYFCAMIDKYLGLSTQIQ